MAPMYHHVGMTTRAPVPRSLLEPAEALTFHHRAWSALGRDELYAVMALRQEVFVVEQRCAYLDADGYDPQAAHLWATGADPAYPIAYCRIFPAGVKYPEASIGRVVSAPSARRTGAGRALMVEALRRMDEAAGSTATVRISAQSYLQRFYEALGFRVVSEPYLEDDIPHLEMLRG
jgi:ElaA protein